MTVQVSQIQTPESSLFQEYSIQNQSDHTFQQYLEEEQKRLAFLFSGWGQLTFDSWFGYPDFTHQQDTPSQPEYISDLEIKMPENYAPKTARLETNQSIADQSFQQITNNYFAKPAQIALQDLLMKTGWLIPNLEAFPLFYQAQLEGKMLSKLDLQFLVDQILTQVKLIKEKGKTELALGMKPENLGEILLTLTSRSGVISIQIQASEEIRKLIEAERRQLELALKKAKVNLAEIKIIGIKEVGTNA